MSEDQEVKIATKKILQMLLLYFGLIFLIMWVLFPFDSIYNLTICVVTILFLGYCCIRDIREITYKKLCTRCGVDIYPIITTAKYYSGPIKHCPFCGENIEKS